MNQDGEDSGLLAWAGKEIDTVHPAWGIRTRASNASSETGKGFGNGDGEDEVNHPQRKTQQLVTNEGIFQPDFSACTEPHAKTFTLMIKLLFEQVIK